MSWLPKQTVVVPVDFSEQSLAAVALGREFVTNPSQLHLIHVLPLLLPAEPGFIWDMVDDAQRRADAEQAIRERIKGTAAEGSHVTVALGDPGREIAEFAERVHAELIVVPSHGRSGISRLLLGSVAERVIRLAHCPVLVLRN